MKLYVLPPSPRALKVVALNNYLGLGCEMRLVDLSKGDQLVPAYVAMNPNRKMPVLEDDGFVLWESNAILFYLASKAPQSGLWPSEPKRQADVLRWMAWESAHWDAESVGMVGYERVSRVVLREGAAEPPFIERGKRNFNRFARVLNDHLAGRSWLAGNDLTIADFSVGAMTHAAGRLGLPVADYPEIGRWYESLASLPGWKEAIVAPPPGLLPG